jgi:hypothetical protein
LAASWKPLMKSNANATSTMIATNISEASMLRSLIVPHSQ